MLQKLFDFILKDLKTIIIVGLCALSAYFYNENSKLKARLEQVELSAKYGTLLNQTAQILAQLKFPPAIANELKRLGYQVQTLSTEEKK